MVTRAGPGGHRRADGPGPADQLGVAVAGGRQDAGPPTGPAGGRPPSSCTGRRSGAAGGPRRPDRRRGRAGCPAVWGWAAVLGDELRWIGGLRLSAASATTASRGQASCSLDIWCLSERSTNIRPARSCEHGSVFLRARTGKRSSAVLKNTRSKWGLPMPRWSISGRTCNPANPEFRRELLLKMLRVPCSAHAKPCKSRHFQQVTNGHFPHQGRSGV